MLVRELTDPQQVDRSIPSNIAEDDFSLFAHESSCHLGPVVQRTLQGVQVFPNAFVASGFSLLPHSAGFSVPRKGLFRHAKDGARLAAFRLGIRKPAVIDHALMPVDEHANGYFHWLCDSLPRLELLAHCGYPLSDTTIIVPHMAVFPYVLPSLEPFQAASIHCGSREEYWRVRHLDLVSPLAPTGNYRPWVMQKLRSRMVAWYGSSSVQPQGEGGGPLRIFISRAKALRRKILGESILDSVLARYGIQKVCLEDLDFPAQVALCARAELIVGLHGAGLSNMLWAPSGAKVLEIRFKGDSHNNCYFSLASAMDQSYWYLLADKESPETDVHDANALVEPSALEAVLEKALGP